MWKKCSFWWIYSCENRAVWSCGSYLAIICKEACHSWSQFLKRGKLRDKKKKKKLSNDIAWVLRPSHAWSWAIAIPEHSVIWINKSLLLTSTWIGFSVPCNLKSPDWSKVTEDEIRQIGKSQMGVYITSNRIRVVETEESRAGSKIAWFTSEITRWPGWDQRQ